MCQTELDEEVYVAADVGFQLGVRPVMGGSQRITQFIEGPGDSELLPYPQGRRVKGKRPFQ